MGVEIGTITFRDPDTLIESALANSSVPVAAFSPGSDSCDNALVEACYFVTYDVNGAVTKVVVDLTISSVTVGDGPTLVQQAFAIEFASAAASAATDAATLGNAVLRGRSGNPGYLVGLPVLNAELVSSSVGEAMNARVPGLRVRGSALSPFCDDSSPSEVVNFGEDIVSSCVLRLSYENFTQMCSQSGNLARFPCWIYLRATT